MVLSSPCGIELMRPRSLTATNFVANIPTALRARQARGYWETISHPEMGKVLVSKPPFRAVGEDRCVPGPPPLLGQHTVEVATTLLGFDEAECRRLVEEKVFY